MKTASIPCRPTALMLILAAEIWLACAASLLVSTPAAAQFSDFPFWGRRPAPQQRQWSPWGGWQQAPEQQQQRWSQPPVDASKAPPPRKPESAPAKSVVVLGDSMADWLGFGLEDAFAETPEIGVLRKYRSYSGLIRGESRKDVDWPPVAKEILAAEKPDFIVMMIGMNDRQAIRERPPRATPKQQPAPQTKLEGGQPTQIGPAAGQQPPDTPEGAAGAEPQKSEPQKPAAAPEPPAGPMMTYEFRSEKWGEAYGRRIDEIIAVLKSKGVPVLWVGLPALRGTRATADIAYLNELYRGHAEKAGITYVDVWDGFVDESGNFAPRGPDFEGQIRLLRAGDGVHFTKAGARKLAHYVEREIRHAMLSRGAPMALPTPEEPQPDASRPGSPAVRPVAGPVVLLTTPASAPEGLLGAGAQRPGVADPNANRVLVKGEPLPALSGRADDFAWPRPNANLQPASEPSAPPASAPAAKPGTAGSPSATKPAAPAPAKKHAPAAAPAGEDGRRPLSLTDDRSRTEPARRRTSPDNGPRPPAAVPLAPTRGGW
jgi:uncharacterized protein